MKDLSNYNVGDKITLRDANYNLMDINIAEDSNSHMAIYRELVEIDDYNKDEILRSREFVMSGMGMMNSTPHSFHVHAVQFRIIERNGQAPPVNERYANRIQLDKTSG